jgi:hypothetical protein
MTIRAHYLKLEISKITFDSQKYGILFSLVYLSETPPKVNLFSAATIGVTAQSF